MSLKPYFIGLALIASAFITAQAAETVVPPGTGTLKTAIDSSAAGDVLLVKATAPQLAQILDKRCARLAQYEGGAVELYDLSNDPHRLENLYGQDGYGKITRELQRFHKSVKQADDVEWQETPVFD